MKKIYLTLVLIATVLCIGCNKESENPFKIESVTALDIEGNIFDKTLVTNHNGGETTIVTYTLIGGKGSLNGNILTIEKGYNAKIAVEATSPAGEVADYTYIYYNADVAVPVITKVELVYTELENSFFALVPTVNHTGDVNCKVSYELLDENGDKIADNSAKNYGMLISAYGTQYYESGDTSSTIRARVENIYGDYDESDIAYKYIEASYPDNYYINETAWKSVVGGQSQSCYSNWRGYEAGLPCILMIGTSISVNYAPYVQDNFNTIGSDNGLKTANVYRIPENSGSTDNGIKQIANYLTGIGTDTWDVVHLNYGLHDLKMVINKTQSDVSINDYKANLRTIFNAIISKGVKKIIWTNTTWYPAGLETSSAKRVYGDEIKYNTAAEEVCKESYYADKIIYCDDHHSITNDTWGKYWTKIDVHPNDSCYKALAESVTSHIKSALSEIKADWEDNPGGF